MRTRWLIPLLAVTALAVLGVSCSSNQTAAEKASTGSTTNVQKGVKYSLDECKARLDDDMRAAIAQVDACAPGLPVPVLAAFGDAVYNIGPKIACDTKHSTAARLLKAGDLAGACQQLPRWNRATVAGRSVELPGLTKRRAKEMDLCLEGAA